jgi:hypothetical protein
MPGATSLATLGAYGMRESNTPGSFSQCERVLGIGSFYLHGRDPTALAMTHYPSGQFARLHDPEGNQQLALFYTRNANRKSNTSVT